MAPDPDPSRSFDRRKLLVGLGAVLAASAAPEQLFGSLPAGLVARGGAAAAPLAPAQTPTGPTACFDIATFDTMSAIAAFVLPGDDEHSHQQGVATPDPGAVAAGAPQSLALALNQILMDPTLVTLILERLGIDLATVPLPGGLDACAAIGSAVEQEGTIPLAPLITALVNLLAVQVNPASVAGPLQVPFARLTWAEKAEAWRRFEVDVPALFAPPEIDLPVVDDLTSQLQTVSGILDFASGAILELAGMFAYTEILVYDRANRRLTARPVGWDLSNYLPGLLWPPDGWDELIGYYQGRTSVDA